NHSGGTVSADAQFLPFDVFSFGYSDQPGFTQADQADAFRRLNAMVKATHPSNGINQFIDGLYTKPVTDPTAQATDAYLPPGWTDQNHIDPETIYKGVLKVGCRGCHMSATNPALSFLDFAGFRSADFDTGAFANGGKIASEVCQAKAMPQSERAVKNFWASGARAYLVDGLHVDLAKYPCTP